MSEKFIEKLMEIINEVITCYYEEAPNNAEFPFGVVPTLNINPLNAGYLCTFDIELYNNELSNITIESMCDLLREHLDSYSYQDNEIGFHLGFENQYLQKQNEQDLIYRRITFSARIFSERRL